MERQATVRGKWSSLLRWIARAWSLASLVLIAGFIVGEGVHLSGWHEYLGFVFFPFGISIGMVVAWWSEALGGSITVGSLAVFYLIYLRTAGTFPPGWAWLVFAAPGFLFLFAAFLSGRTNPAAT